MKREVERNWHAAQYAMGSAVQSVVRNATRIDFMVESVVSIEHCHGVMFLDVEVDVSNISDNETFACMEVEIDEEADVKKVIAADKKVGFTKAYNDYVEEMVRY